MLTNKRIVQNGFHAQTLQAQISQDNSEWYVLIVFIIIIIIVLYIFRYVIHHLIIIIVGKLWVIQTIIYHKWFIFIRGSEQLYKKLQ